MLTVTLDNQQPPTRTHNHTATTPSFELSQCPACAAHTSCISKHYHH